MQDATLVLLLKGDPIAEILLGYKKIGFGQGKFTGIGGKIERGEELMDAAIRELVEETGVRVPDSEYLQFSSILEFQFPSKRSWNHRVFVFFAQHWEGVPVESNEIRPRWFAIEDIPYGQMWDDARYWLPLSLAGEKFRARFRFRADNATVKKVVFKPIT